MCIPVYMKSLNSFNLENLVNSFKNVSKKAVGFGKGITATFS